MRLLNYWAAAAGAMVFCATGCLTSQDNPSGGGGSVEDPPIDYGKGGSGGGSQGGDAGEDTGGSGPKGGRSGAGGAGGGQSGSGACEDDTDCELRVGSPKCSVPTGECVECLTVSDCGSGAAAECVNNVCRPIATCGTMNECPVGLVCNPATDRCVECATPADCRADETCAGNVCRPSCTVDGHCAPFGLICGNSGYCVSCLTDSDCPDERYCQVGTGTCVRDICVAGSGTCAVSGTLTYLTTCNEAGSMFENPILCPTGTTCTEEDPPRCATQICTPGTVRCSTTSDAVVECSEDGLDETPIEECDTGEFCIASTLTCMAAVCAPSMRSCQGDVLYQCDSAGTVNTPIQDCAATMQFCDESTPPAACRALLCTPNMPACDGNVLRTCNATGTGYTGTGTDCTTTMQSCSPSGCTDAIVDTIPPTNPQVYTSALSGYTFVNFYSVASSRTLTSIEVYMNSPSSTTPLTWVVYESTTQTGTYATRLLATPTTSTVGLGYQSSGAISVPLQVGRFYAIGVHFGTPAITMGYQTGSVSTQTVSFGTLLSAGFPMTTAPTTTMPYGTSTSVFIPQRLTTTL